MDELTPRQRRFCEEYLLDLNGAAAARRAGYASSGSRQEATRLLANAVIKAEIDRLNEARSKRTQVTSDMVVAELAKLSFSNMLDYIIIQDDGTAVVDFSMVDRDKGAAMQEVTIETYAEGGGEDARQVKRVRFKLADKRSALELLGKHLAIFTERVDMNVTGDVAAILERRRRRAGLADED